MKLVKEKAEIGGYHITVIVGANRYKSYWSSPPTDIDHVGKGYLEDRYPVITTQKRADIFKKLYKQLW